MRDPGSTASGQMSEAHFKLIAALAYDEAGLVFPPSKASLVRSRINRRLRALNMSDFSTYCAFVTSNDGKVERRMMISSLTTNISNFFREAHHFELLQDTVLPPLLKRARSGGRVRIWSAGCSNGQEAYSIAMTIADMAADFQGLDIKILASDIDPEVIRTAKRGFYPNNEVRDVPTNYADKFLTTASCNGHSGVEVIPALRAMISFRELNLLHDWPMSRPFDVIFCRNVVIYFDARTQENLWQKFHAITASGGWLIVGHSERLSETTKTDFETAGPTAYHRPDVAA